MLEQLSASHIALLKANFKEPQGGWPEPLTVPRPGDSQLVDQYERPLRREPAKRRPGISDREVVAELFKDQVSYSPPQEGRHRPKMRDPNAPSGPVFSKAVSDGD